MIRVYEWQKVPNWGDRLSVPLLRHYAEIDAQSTGDPNEADLFCVGSVAQHIPAGFTGTVLGSGKMFNWTRWQPGANVLAVRGPLSHVGVPGRSVGNVVLGDPGLIADELVPTPERIYARGILPHWSDKQLATRREFWDGDPLFIDPADDPLTVISQIGSCEVLVTSSLHGIVLACAFGIPFRFEPPPGQLAAEGGMYKHNDFAASIGLDLKVGVSLQVGVKQSANKFKVNEVRHRLIDAFEQYGRSVRG